MNLNDPGNSRFERMSNWLIVVSISGFVFVPLAMLARSFIAAPFPVLDPAVVLVVLLFGGLAAIGSLLFRAAVQSVKERAPGWRWVFIGFGLPAIAVAMTPAWEWMTLTYFFSMFVFGFLGLLLSLVGAIASSLK